MFTEKLRILIKKYETLQLDVSLTGNHWKIKIDSDNVSSTEDQKVFIKEDDNDYYDLLTILMPGTCLKDEYGDNIGYNETTECFSYKNEEDKIILYSGYTYNDGITVIEKYFENELEFYTFLFDKYSNINLRSEELRNSCLKTPFDLFVSYILESGYILKGFKEGSTDDEGYKVYAMVLVKKDEEKYIVEYPIKDAFFSRFESNYLDLRKVSIINFDSQYLKLLEIIRNDNIENYIEAQSW